MSVMCVVERLLTWALGVEVISGLFEEVLSALSPPPPPPLGTAAAAAVVLLLLLVVVVDPTAGFCKLQHQ